MQVGRHTLTRCLWRGPVSSFLPLLFRPCPGALGRYKARQNAGRPWRDLVGPCPRQGVSGEQSVCEYTIIFVLRTRICKSGDELTICTTRNARLGQSVRKRKWLCGWASSWPPLVISARFFGGAALRSLYTWIDVPSRKGTSSELESE